jgi:hypothetical protein
MITFSLLLDPKELNDRTYDLFEKGSPKNDYERVALSESYIKKAEGKIDAQAAVKLENYGYSVMRNTKMAISKRYIPFINSDEHSRGFSGVVAGASCVGEFENNEGIKNVEDQEVLEGFYRVHDELIIEEGVHLIELLKNALNANYRVIMKLKDLIERYQLEELIDAILKNEELIEVLNLKELCRRSASFFQSSNECTHMAEPELMSYYVQHAWSKTKQRVEFEEELPD